MSQRHRAFLRLAASLTLGASLAAGCGGTSAGPATPRLVAPPRSLVPLAHQVGVPRRYEYQRVDTLTSVLPNGGRQQQVVERRFLITWTAAPGPDGLALTISLDSVHVSGPNARTLEDSARGSVIRGRLSPTGRLDSLSSSDVNGLDRTFLAALPWLVPRYPQSTAEGATVTDTLEATVPLGMLDIDERTVRQVRLGATVGALELWGDLTRQGAAPELALTGTGTRSAHAEVDPAGRLLHLSGRDSVAMQVVASATGQSVQLLQIETYTLTSLP